MAGEKKEKKKKKKREGSFHDVSPGRKRANKFNPGA